jgi:hypothetical protein
VPNQIAPAPGFSNSTRYGKKSTRKRELTGRALESIAHVTTTSHALANAKAVHYPPALKFGDLYCFNTFVPTDIPTKLNSSASQTTEEIYAAFETDVDWGWSDRPAESQHTTVQKFWANMAWGTEPTPKSFDAAMKSERAKQWKTATDKEIFSHDDRGTWTLVPRSEARAAGIPVVPSIWVLVDKMMANGDTKEKARIVACGKRQTPNPEVDTFAATAQTTTLRVVLNIAAALDLDLRNGDFSVAFLNAEALETVYMEQPKGYSRKDPKTWVCKLHLGLYGTRAANRGWSLELHAALTEFGLQRSTSDHGLYFMKHDGKPAFLVTHVDDLIWAGDLGIWSNLVKFLQTKYEFTDLGELEWILGMRVRRNRRNRTIILDQERYTRKMAEQFGLDGMNPADTPALPNVPLTAEMSPTTPEEIEEMKTKPYRALVGSLLFLTVCTRPDIAQAVGALCRFQANPGLQHWTAAKRVLRYVLDTAALGLTFGGSNNPAFELVAFCDADWAGDRDTRRSTSGYFFLLYGGIVSYKSILQHCVALSTCEAEYIAAAETAREAVWLFTLISEISMAVLPLPIRLNEDNQGAIALAKNPVGHGRNKHIDIRHHFLRDLVNEGKIVMTYIPTADQLADIFTKPLGRARFLALRRALMGV